MNKIELLELMSNPARLTHVSLSALLEIADEYPYFQTAHLLVAQKIAQTDTGTAYDSFLARAATVASSREMMYKLLNSPPDTGSKQQPFVEASYSATNIDAQDTVADESNNEDFEDELGETLLAGNRMDIINNNIADFSEKPTEAVRIPDNFFHDETQLDTYNSPSAQDLETEDVRDIYTRLMEKTENKLEEVAQKTEKTVPPVSGEVILHAKNEQENLSSTAEIARLQVEQELKEVEELHPVYSDADTADLSTMLESEARDIIRYDVERDVERDLETLKKIPLFREDEQEEAPEPTLLSRLDNEGGEGRHLLKNLQEKVELFKKEKEILPTADEILPPLSLKQEDAEAIQGLVNKSATNHDDADISYHDLQISEADMEQQKRQNLSNTESILSETMARVYARQGYYDKAIQIYEQLQAKFPEKGAYFAQKIEQLKG